jgi:hypothetical protein
MFTQGEAGYPPAPKIQPRGATMFLTTITIIIGIALVLHLFVYGRAFLYSFTDEYKVDKRLHDVTH